MLNKVQHFLFYASQGIAFLITVVFPLALVCFSNIDGEFDETFLPVIGLIILILNGIIIFGKSIIFAIYKLSNSLTPTPKTMHHTLLMLFVIGLIVTTWGVFDMFIDFQSRVTGVHTFLFQFFYIFIEIPWNSWLCVLWIFRIITMVGIMGCILVDFVWTIFFIYTSSTSTKYTQLTANPDHDLPGPTPNIQDINMYDSVHIPEVPPEITELKIPQLEFDVSIIHDVSTM